VKNPQGINRRCYRSPTSQRLGSNSSIAQHNIQIRDRRIKPALHREHKAMALHAFRDIFVIRRLDHDPVRRSPRALIDEAKDRAPPPEILEQREHPASPSDARR
jgi:hypothetical protein